MALNRGADMTPDEAKWPGVHLAYDIAPDSYVGGVGLGGHEGLTIPRGGRQGVRGSERLS